MAKSNDDQEALENGGGLLRPDLASFLYDGEEEYVAGRDNIFVVRSNGTLICVEADCEEGTSLWFGDASDFIGEYYFDQEIAAMNKAIENMTAEGMAPKTLRRN